MAAEAEGTGKGRFTNSNQDRVSVGTLVTQVAEVIAALPSISGGGGEDRSEAIVGTLLGVISGLSKVARDHAQLERAAAREQEAVRLLNKFKKVAKQQQEVIEMHDSKLKEAEENALIRHPSPPPPVPAPMTTYASVNTDLTQAYILQMERDCDLQKTTLEALREKSSRCNWLEEQLRSSVAQTRKLRLVVKRAQGVIEAQKTMLDGMEETLRKQKSRTPSRENTPSRASAVVRALSGAPGVPTFPTMPSRPTPEVDDDPPEEEQSALSSPSASDDEGGGNDVDGDTFESQEEEEFRQDSVDVSTSFDLIQLHYRQNA